MNESTREHGSPGVFGGPTRLVGGIKKESKKAVELIRPHGTSSEGHFMAFLLLAEVYEHGEGVKKDTDEASRIWERSISGNGRG